ncbi:MAG TPA: vanadium-dependent haloperoxidase [Chitinophagaceae bacterium]
MKKKILHAGLLIAFLSVFNFACQKQIDQPSSHEEIATVANKGQGHLKQTKTFSSDVVRSWINMQLVMLRLPLPAGTGAQGTDRSQGYTGIALYEAVVPGMPAYQSLVGQLTNFPEMPSTEPGKTYHWAASANAALAEISRRLFPTTANANKTAIDNLENSLKTGYANEADAATLERSIAFGKEVATRVANWAATDGSANVNPPYVAPVGFGLWIPTAPPPAAAVNPYAYQRRLMVPGSDAGTALAPPPPFSTNPSSAYYAMVKRVYDASLVLTTDQKAMADYFKDNPGYGAGGGFVWVLQEALRIAQPTLDQAALTYAKVGMAQHDVTIVLFTNKYNFLTMRPVTYIRANINPTWNTYIPTPNHPEFPSGHATTNGAVLTMMSNSFGENFPMTLHTYDYLGYAPRHYNTFTEMGTDMADSRVYGGLHYVETQEKSLVQGKKVAQNILNTIKFLKE